MPSKLNAGDVDHEGSSCVLFAYSEACSDLRTMIIMLFRDVDAQPILAVCCEYAAMTYCITLATSTNQGLSCKLLCTAPHLSHVIMQTLQVLDPGPACQTYLRRRKLQTLFGPQKTCLQDQ